MTDKVTLNHVTSFVNDSSAVTTVNANLDALTVALDNTLSRDGTSPNQMAANIDMNGFNIINLPYPATLDSPARLVDVIVNPTVTVPTVGTSGGTVPLLNGNNTWSGTNTYNAATTFTVAPTSVTPATNDNTTKVATTAYVQANILGASNIAGLSVMGNSGATSAVPAAITGTANQLLGVNAGGTALAFETVSGDATCASGALTLATVNANTGAWGSSTAIPTITLDAKGRATSASTNAVVAPASTLSGTVLNAPVITSSLTTVGNSVKFGADAASPATSTVAGNSTLSGTTNTAGADLILAGGKGTGSGAGGSLRVQTSPAGGSGTSQNAGVDRWVIDAPGNVVAGTSSLTTTSTDGFFYIPNVAGPPTGVPTSKSGHVPMCYDSTNNKFYIYNGAWKGVVLA